MIMIDIDRNTTCWEAERLTAAAGQRIADAEARHGKQIYLIRDAGNLDRRDDSNPAFYMLQARAGFGTATRLIGEGAYGEAAYCAREASLKAIQADNCAASAIEQDKHAPTRLRG